MEVAVNPRFRVLGPVQVRDSTGRWVSVRGPRQRAVICALVAEAGHPVSVDRLIDRVWGAAPPPSAMSSLYAYVSRLRTLLDPDRSEDSPLVSATGAGYLLHATPADVDAALFELLVDWADESPADTALDVVEAALALWGGIPYADLGDAPDVAALRQPLVEQRLRTTERKVTALLELDRAAQAASVALTLVREEPLREGYWRHLMLASYRAGHLADALAGYARCRRLLEDELGIGPQADTEALYLAILRHDPGLRPAPPNRPPGAETARPRSPRRSAVVRPLSAARPAPGAGGRAQPTLPRPACTSRPESAAATR